MTTRVHSELRKLALAYYRGWIPRDKYLSIRSKYLKAISKDQIPDPIDPKEIAPPAREEPAPYKKSNMGTWLTLGIFTLAVATAGYWFFTGVTPDKAVQPAPAETPEMAAVQEPAQSAIKPKPVVPVAESPAVETVQVTETEEATETTEAAETVETVEPPPPTEEELFTAYLETELLGQHNWDPQTLDSFKLKWLGLSQQQQDNISGTQSFREFKRSLIERIVDERKLNNIVPSDYELALMTVAKNVGVINEIPAPE
jgi:hypothetical protein